MNNANIYTVGGTVQAGDGIYLPRRADEDLLALCRKSAFTYVLTSRQMGKSSLMVQTATRLAEEGIHPVIVDLQQLGVGVTAQEWYLGVLTTIEDCLELETDAIAWWEERQLLGMAQRLTLFFEEVLLREVEGQIVVFVDEIDTTLSLDFTDDFFAAVRYLYTVRSQKPEFRRLSFVLVGVATPSDLIRDPKRTPFNIGQRVDLTDFTPVEARPFAGGLGLSSRESDRVLGWILDWTGGHPYLTQSLCVAIAGSREEVWTEEAIAVLVRETFLGARREQDSNLQFVRDMLVNSDRRSLDILAVFKTYRQIWQNRKPVMYEEHSIVQAHLKLSGIIKQSGRRLLVRNAIYQQVFDGQWLRERWPETYWQRLKPAIPYIASSFFITATITGLALYADAQRREVQYQKQVLEVQEKAAFAVNLGNSPQSSKGLIFAIYAVDLSWKLRQGENSDLERKTQHTHWSMAQSSLSIVRNLARERMVFDNHKSVVRSVAFSPDGKRVVSGSLDTTIRLWDLQGNPIGEPFRGHKDSVLSVAFSPDGQQLISSGDDTTIRLWDLQGNPIGEPFRGHEDWVGSVAFSPDGQRLISGSADKTIRLWDLQGNPIGEPFRGHEDSVLSVAFSPDGQRLISGSADKTIRLWDLQGNPIGEPFRGHEDWVWSVAFSPDGQRIVSGSTDKTIRLWNLQGNPIGEPIRGHEDSVLSVAFSLDGQRIAGGGIDGVVRLWDLEGNPISEPFYGHEDWVWSVAFSPDGQHIISGSEDKTVRLSDLHSINTPFRGHEDSVWSVAFSPDGKHIISGSWDKTVRLWNLQGNPIGEPFYGHKDWVWSVAFSPDGQQIVSGSDDKTVRLWDLQGNPIGEPFRGHDFGVLWVAFSPDGQRIVSGSDDKTVRLWDLQGNPIGEPFRGHKDKVLSVAFSPDGQRIVSGSEDTTIRLWDLQGNLIGKPFYGHDNLVGSVAFSPDGQRIVSGSNDKTVRLWDLQGNPIGEPFRGHERGILSVAFSPDGQRIVSGSNDKTVRLWDLQGNLIGKPFRGHENWVGSVALSPDGKQIVSSGGDKTVRLWRSSWQSWLELACNRLKHHRILREPDRYGDEEFVKIAEDARDACKYYVWSKSQQSP